jgi:bifunctional DNA-binding transcriptional regulator/antitoxin component of YhaV-PrlF toxin-antitoxin module
LSENSKHHGFYATVQDNNRITIPHESFTGLELAKDDLLHVKINKVGNGDGDKHEFYAYIQELNRIAIPIESCDAMDIKKGTRIYAAVLKQPRVKGIVSN